jgi:NifU-like protein
MRQECENQGKDCKNCWFYTDTVKDHMFNPRNIFRTEEECKSYDADGIGEVGSPACGDMMRFLIKIKGNKIKDCKWQTYGCGTAIASTSIFSEMIQGMAIDDALKITSKDIADRLGGVPQHKFHCSILAARAFKEAVEDYRKKNG